MKKTIIAIAISFAASMAMALDVGVTAVHDYSLTSTGVRATVSTAKVSGFTPQASVTRLGGEYTRYAAGGKYDLAKIGPVTFFGVGSGVFQDTVGAASGYGLSAGLVASVPVYKNVALEVGVERFAGQDRISNRDGTLATVGLNAKF
jgi:hypothetical protein